MNSTLSRSENLPNDIIHDILSRLSPELIVCSWNGSSSAGSITLYVIHETAEGGTMIAEKSQINLLHANIEVKLFTSCNGFLLFTTPSTYLIFNPITREQAIVRKPSEYMLLGFYLDRNTGEYRILCVRENRVMVYGVKSKTWRRTAAMIEDLPRKEIPVVVNGAMHWLVYFREVRMNQIQIFDIESEKPGRMRVPVDLTKYVDEFEIVEMRGDNGMTLGFVDNCRPMHLDIWVLEDYANQVWKFRHSINLGGVRGVRVAKIHNKDGLVVKWGGHYYHHNIKLNTWSKILELGVYSQDAIHQNCLLSSLV